MDSPGVDSPTPGSDFSRARGYRWGSVGMNTHGYRRDAWHRLLDETQVESVHSSATRLALAEATRLARECHDRHHLLKPFEAMAVACLDDHPTETLYSIARNAALSTGGDIDVVFRHLEHTWPDFV